MMASAAKAQRHGIAAIYQEPLLFPDLNVAREHIHRTSGSRRLHELAPNVPPGRGLVLRTLGIVLDVRSPARGLTLAAQSVEIAKAISLNVQVLIMDEPTASLSAHEAAMLVKLVRARGRALQSCS